MKETQERVKVHCRLRPLGSAERGGTYSCEGEKIIVKGNDEEEEFTFDSAFSHTANQDTVFNISAAPVVASTLEGYNGTVFAYGQTGSGKTYSMFGPENEELKNFSDTNATLPESAGIIPRSLKQIFDKVDNDNANEYEVSLSYVQIYCEIIYDLFEPTNDSLLLRESSSKGIYIEGVQRIPIKSVQEGLSYVSLGTQNRACAATNLNENSSRSHSCLIVEIGKRSVQPKTDNKKPKMVYGKLFLVDLAGSERVKRALSSNHHHLGTRFLESKAINLSLSALGNCISALSKNRGHIPYRDSKLTRLLRNSLGGNCRTSLILNISPASESNTETKSTLCFGKRAMNVKTKPHINQEIDYESLFKQLQAVVDKKDDQIHSLEIVISKKQIELDEANTKNEKNREAKESLQVELEKIRNIMKVQEESSEENQESMEHTRMYAEQITILQEENQEKLRKVKQDYEMKFEKKNRVTQNAEEEWNRIEYDLKDEKEEHLRTLKSLREKQHQIIELEKTHGERIGELHDQLNDLKIDKNKLESRLRSAFEERSAYVKKNELLEKELERYRDFEARGLKIMETLTNRVKLLEQKREEDERQDEDSYKTSSRRQNAKSLNSTIGYGNRSMGTRKPTLQPLSGSSKRSSYHSNSLAASILRG